MRNSDYWVYVRDWAGKILRDFSGFIELEYSRSFNNIGALSLSVPGFISDLRRDQQVVVMRSALGGAPYRDGNTVWFVTGWEYDFDTDVTIVHAQDAIGLLRKRIVAYRGGTAYSTKTDENGGLGINADNMARAFVRENFCKQADMPEFPAAGVRIMSGFITESDNSAFPETEKDAPFRNVYDVVHEIAEEQTTAGRAMLFDVVPDDDGNFTFSIFDTWLGQDRSGEIVFGPAANNMSNAKIEIDWTNTVTVAYVGGAGEDDARRVAPRVSPALTNGIGRTPYERSEAFVDMRDVDDDSVLETEGDAFLAANRVKLTASGTVVDTATSVYGRDFFYGDRVTCDFGVLTFVAIINSIHVTVTFEDETIDIKLSTDDYDG